MKAILEQASYPLAEAAHYLRIPRATLRSWLVGAYYPTARGRSFFRPLIRIADREAMSLSFMNLVEAHVLSAIRTQHRIPMHKVRRTLDFFAKERPSAHPLADHEFETNGVDLFVTQYGRLVNLSQSGQLAMQQILKQYLKRIGRDSKGTAVRLYPFTRVEPVSTVKAIVIDPAVEFGRPVIAGTGIPTAIVAERYKAGESVVELAKDYGRTHLEIEEAIRCELQIQAA